MNLLQASNRSVVKLDSRPILGVGGEARIFAVKDRPDLAAKIYHRPTVEHAAKVTAMIRNPPEDPMTELGKVSITWPSDLLMDAQTEKFMGFLMPRVKGMHPIIDFYHPKTRRQKHPLFDFRYLLRAARNLAACIGALHARGYVVGDLNESNILVADTALVTLVDTDSFQVPDAEVGKVHRCGVGKVEFTPPELQGVNFAWVDRQREQDSFGLGVLIFQLLMEGIHPFAGRHLGFGEPPTLEQRIGAGWFPYKPSQPLGTLPMPTAPRFESLPPRVRELLVQCFVEGHREPSRRPNSQAWQLALLSTESSLTTCGTNEQHHYGNHLAGCPWCERAKLFGGLDVFPSREMVKNRLHLRPPTRSNDAQPISSLSYEEAVVLAVAGAKRKKRMRWVYAILITMIGGGLVLYWSYAIEHWVFAH